MDGVGEQCDAAGIPDNDDLEECGDEQAREGPLDRTDPAFRGEDGRIYDPVRVAVPGCFFRTVNPVVLLAIPVVVVISVSMVVAGLMLMGMLLILTGGVLVLFPEHHVTVYPFPIPFHESWHGTGKFSRKIFHTLVNREK